MDINETPVAGDETPNEGQTPDPIQAQLEQMRETQERLLALFESQQKKPTQGNDQKQLTPAEFQALLASNPSEAIAKVVDGRVQAGVAQATALQQKQFYDQKAEMDFPSITTDRDFQNLVRKEMSDLISGGMSETAPKLVYKAAEIASMKRAAKKPQAQSNPTISGEAPTTVRSQPGAGKKPEGFDTIAQAFGLSEAGQKKVLAKMQQRSARNSR